MITDENTTVNSLWIGENLSLIELLTIKSFISRGHRFKLWLYGPLNTRLPEAVEICDASEIISKSKVFVYKNKNEYGHGLGSVAGFSDIFRYKLLYEYGGWWVDMDVTCLKRLDFTQPYYFRKHHDLKLVGNVMKCPAKSELMLKCYEEGVQTIDENNTNWHKPIDILNRHVAMLGLQKYVECGHSNIDRWEKTNRFILTSLMPPLDWYFIHWQNEEWKYRNLSKSRFYYRSFLAQLLRQYDLLILPGTLWQRLINYSQNVYSYIKNGLTYLKPKFKL